MGAPGTILARSRTMQPPHDELHRAGHTVLLPADGRRAVGRPPAAGARVPIQRRAGRSLLRDDPAGPTGLLRGCAGRWLPLAVPAPLLHAAGTGRVAGRVLRGRPHLLLVAPPQPPGELPLGGARRAPPERGLQPGGRPPAGGAVGVDHLAVPPAAGAGGRAAGGLCDGGVVLHALPVLDPHRAGREARLVRTRLQHAVNPRYLDRNYAATLCIWDRLFGTFEEEREQPVFGLVKPLTSFNPLWAQVQAWAALWRASREARGLDRLRVWLKGPDWRPGGLSSEAPEVTRAAQRKHDPGIPAGLVAYVAANLMAAIAGTTYLLFTQFTLSLPLQLSLAALVLLTLLGWGGLMERRRWRSE